MGKIIDMMHSICCPLSLRKAIIVSKKVLDGELENDEQDNSSNSFMIDGLYNRSYVSAHEDAIDGVFTNYVDLRSFIVHEKTIALLLELLDIPKV